MSDLIINDVDEALVEALATRALANRATLAETAEALLRSALDGQPEEGYGPAAILDIANRVSPSDSVYLIRRDRDGVAENELTAADALRTVRELRSIALRPMLPDSTPSIRMDRDA